MNQKIQNLKTKALYTATVASMTLNNFIVFATDPDSLAGQAQKNEEHTGMGWIEHLNVPPDYSPMDSLGFILGCLLGIMKAAGAMALVISFIQFANATARDDPSAKLKSQQAFIIAAVLLCFSAFLEAVNLISK